MSDTDTLFRSFIGYLRMLVINERSACIDLIEGLERRAPEGSERARAFADAVAIIRGRMTSDG